MEEKKIWLCPLCHMTLRSEADFLAHIQRKSRMLTEALVNPEKHAKLVRPS